MAGVLSYTSRRTARQQLRGNVRWLVVETRLPERPCSGRLTGETLCGTHRRLARNVRRTRNEGRRRCSRRALSAVGIVIRRPIHGDIDRNLTERCDKWIDRRGRGDLTLVRCDVLTRGERRRGGIAIVITGVISTVIPVVVAVVIVSGLRVVILVHMRRSDEGGRHIRHVLLHHGWRRRTIATVPSTISGCRARRHSLIWQND